MTECAFGPPACNLSLTDFSASFSGENPPGFTAAVANAAATAGGLTTEFTCDITPYQIEHQSSNQIEKGEVGSILTVVTKSCASARASCHGNACAAARASQTRCATTATML
jgi:hypothetical protein